jgi:hypothetical protein
MACRRSRSEVQARTRLVRVCVVCPPRVAGVLPTSPASGPTTAQAQGEERAARSMSHVVDC